VTVEIKFKTKAEKTWIFLQVFSSFKSSLRSNHFPGFPKEMNFLQENGFFFKRKSD